MNMWQIVAALDDGISNQTKADKGLIWVNVPEGF